MSAAAAPLPRVKSFHGGKAGEKVRQSLRGRAGNWMCGPRRNVPDLFRISKSVYQAGFLYVVQSYTTGAPKRKSTRLPEFTPPLTAQDLAKELGFRFQQMYEMVDDAIRRGLAERKCGCAAGDTCRSRDHHSYRLCVEKWEKLPNAFIPRENGLNGKGEEKEKSHSTGTEAAGRVKLNKPVRVAPGKRYELPEETPATAVEVETAEGSDIVVTITDGALLRIAARPALVDEKKPDRSPRAAPSPPAAADPLVAGLAERGYPIDPAFAARLRKDLGACKDLEFFFQVLAEEVERARRKRQPVITAGLIQVARNAAGRFPAYWQAQRVPIERELARKREMLADSSFDAEERAFIDGEVRRLVARLGGES